MGNALGNKEKFMALIASDIIKQSDALVVLEGDGYSRLLLGVNLYYKNYAKKIILSGGLENSPMGSYHSDKLYFAVTNLAGIPESNIIRECESIHTRGQAEHVINVCLDNNFKKIILIASHFHQYRAFLTFLKVNQEKNANLIIYNSPANDVFWFFDPGWGKRIDLLEKEFEKIDEYSQKGHIASFEDAINYQQWKENQK
jgi:uncharacterized SAM-binding protein YcdF (DUF218 family)